MKKARLSHFSIRLTAGAFFGWTVLGGLAQADTINFSQFGSELSSIASGATGSTAGGVGFTINGPGTGTFTRVDEGSIWAGIFPAGAPLLFDDYNPGAIEILFVVPISSLTIAAQPNLSGFFTETVEAYKSGNVLVDTKSANADAEASGPEGAIPLLTVTSSVSDIVRVLISTTNATNDSDFSGIAIYSAGAPSVATPLPGTLPLLLSGLGVLGLMRRAKRRARADR